MVKKAKVKKTKKAPRRASKKKPKAARSKIWRVIGGLCAIVAVVFLIWVVYLDFEVRSKFDGRKWALPARVYAQPLELYVGQQLTAADLKAELSALEYQQVTYVKRSGQWSARSSNEFEIYIRGFAIADDVESDRYLRLRIANSQIVSLKGEAGGSVPLARLEPPLIGGIYPKQREDRSLVQLHEVPALLGETLIAIEDRAFVDHWGVSPRAIARAMLVNMKSGRIVQGGSTLTQQLVKNFFLDQSRSLSRKLTEAVMSVLLELHYSKAEILETYLNEIYLGQSGPREIHGFGLAAKHYFRRPVQQLEVHEIALLIGLVKGASYYNPWRNPERALGRRNLVIDVMLDQELIGVSQAKTAKSKSLGVVSASKRRLHDYPAFIDLVKRQLREDYSAEELNSEGLKIYSTMSLRAQGHVERALTERLKSLESAYKATGLQGAVVLAAVGSGEVEAVVGDRNTQFSGFNRALDARRSIGSLIKPVVYLTALQNGYNLASKISDAPVSVKGPDGKLWQPRNFDRISHGDVFLIDALTQSYNLAAARLGMDVGLGKVWETMQSMGVEVETSVTPAMLLGSVSLTPMEVLGLYHVLANDGVKTPMRAIRTVVDAQNHHLNRYPLEIEQVVDLEAAHLIQFAMQNVMQEGTGRGVYQQLPRELMLAGKTGTTNNQRDSWFAGFSGQHIAVAWIGKDDNSITPLTGSSGALRVWRDVFRRLPTQGLALSQGGDIEYLWVDKETGGLSDENCMGARRLPFETGQTPDFNAQCQRRKNPISHWFDKWLR